MTRYIITAGCTAGILFSIAACGGGLTEPSTSTPFPPAVSIFSGTLPVGGSSVHALTVTQASNATAMLASVAVGPLATPVSTIVGVALGTPTEEGGCTRTLDRRLTPSLTAQIRTELSAIPRCLEVYDAGTLTTEVTFAVRVVVTPVSNTTPATAAPGTEIFSSVLTVHGSASRSVNASQPGQLSAIVTTASPPNVLVGLGLGIPRVDGGGCYLSTSVNTLTSAAISVAAPVDAGTYCVKLYDLGSLTGNVNFTIAAVHP